MVSNNLNKQILWEITLISKQNLSDKDRDFMVELVSEEARKTIESYSFILHDVIESKKYSKMLIEGTKMALNNLRQVIEDNLPYKIYFSKYVK